MLQELVHCTASFAADVKPDIVPNAVVSSSVSKKTTSKMLTKTLGNHDWLRVILIIALNAYLFYLMYSAVVRVEDRQIGSTEVARDALLFLMPSITFCPAVMSDISNKIVANITQDYDNLPKLKDWIEATEIIQNVIIDNR